MIQELDERLRREALRFHLVFACPDCASFDPDGVRCSLGFPVEPHLQPTLDGRDELVFCKAFELW